MEKKLNPPPPRPLRNIGCVLAAWFLVLSPRPRPRLPQCQCWTTSKAKTKTPSRKTKATIVHTNIDIGGRGWGAGKDGRHNTKTRTSSQEAARDLLHKLSPRLGGLSFVSIYRLGSRSGKAKTMKILGE